MNVVYLDNNATTQVAPEVLDGMLPFLRDFWGNPSSMHSFGGSVKKHIEKAREQVASLLGADPSEIIFTSCGTESDNTAIRGTYEALNDEKIQIITTRVEHPAVLGPCRRLKEMGANVVEIGVTNDGSLKTDEYVDALKRGKSIVSIMWANNETGVLFPVNELANLAKENGAIFHTDAVQAVGKIKIELKNSNIDLLSLSGHKLHAPKGIGALYIRKGTKLQTFMIGGHQENGRRGGTENVAGIVGLGIACELAQKHFEEENTRVVNMRDRLEKEILAKCPDSMVNGNRKYRLPNTTNISFQYIEGEAILYHLSDFGIAASSGSACTSGSLEPSHVIRAMGVPFTAAHGSIRFSLSRYNTDEEISCVIEKMPEIVQKLRNLSPFVNH